MADKDIQWGSSSSFGTIAGFNPQGDNYTSGYQRASSDDGNGDETASKLYDRRIDRNQTFKGASATTVGVIPPIIGAICGSVLLTRIEIKTSGTDFPTLSLTGHQHGSNAHANDRRQAAHGIVLAVAFGAQDFLGSTYDGDDVELVESTAVISVQHKDEPGQNGEHATGQNYKGMIEVTQEYLGDGEDKALVGTGWDKVSVDVKDDPQGNQHTTIHAQKAFSLSAPTPSSST